MTDSPLSQEWDDLHADHYGRSGHDPHTTPHQYLERGPRLTGPTGRSGTTGYPSRGRSVGGYPAHEWWDPSQGHHDPHRGYLGPSQDYDRSYQDPYGDYPRVNDPGRHGNLRGYPQPSSYPHQGHPDLGRELERANEINIRLMARLDAHEGAMPYGTHVPRARHRAHRPVPSASASRPPGGDADGRRGDGAARYGRADPEPRYMHDVRVDSGIRTTGERTGTGAPEHASRGPYRSGEARGGRDAAARALQTDSHGYPLPHGGGGGAPLPRGKRGRSPSPGGSGSGIIMHPDLQKGAPPNKRTYLPSEMGSYTQPGSRTGIAVEPSLAGSKQSLGISKAGTGVSGGGGSVAGNSDSESEITPNDSVSQVRGNHDRIEPVKANPVPVISPQPDEVTSPAEAENVYLRKWNEGMDALGDYLQLPKPDPVQQQAKRARITVEGDPVCVSVPPRRLPLHNRVVEAFTEYEGKAKDTKCTKYAPIAKFKPSYFEPLELDEFMSPAKLPESWDKLAGQVNKGEDDPLKVKESTFKELLAGQSVRCHIHDAMHEVIKALPAEAGQHAQTLRNLSYLMHKVSVQEVDYVASLYGTTLLRRRDNYLGNTKFTLSEAEVRELRGSPFGSTSLFEACTPEFARQAEERNDKVDERQSRLQPHVIQLVNAPKGQQAKAPYSAPNQTQQGQSSGPKANKPKGNKKKKSFKPKSASSKPWDKPKGDKNTPKGGKGQKGPKPPKK